MALVTITRLGLNKLFLWSEADRLQTYPQALARAEAGRTYTRREIGETFFDLAYVRGRKALRDSVLANCFGVEQVAQDKLVVRGVNLFRSTLLPRRQPMTPPGVPPRYFTADDPWQPTEVALALGAAYRADPDDDEWLILLARQLARYELRTRLVLHLLGGQGWSLRFVEDGFFSVPSVEARLARGDETIALFADDGNAFNRLFVEYIQIALGPWWHQEIRELGYELGEDFVIQQATTNRLPSTNNLNSALKTALWVFYTLDAIIEGNEGWMLDPDRAFAVLGKEISGELMGISYHTVNPLTALREAVDGQADALGFVVVSRLIERWGSIIGIPSLEREETFDRFIREKLYSEEVRILARHPGQPRLGRGLLGDDSARKIRLEIVPTIKEEE